jgi:hypothetical protein
MVSWIRFGRSSESAYLPDHKDFRKHVFVFHNYYYRLQLKTPYIKNRTVKTNMHVIP